MSESGGVDPRLITTDSQFAAALTTIRLRAGRSIRELGKVTGIPSATLGGYFSGRHLPPATQPQLFGQVLAGLGIEDPDEVEAWRGALLRVRRTGPRPATGADARDGATPVSSPYRGLEPFTEQDAELFFGRESSVRDVVSAIERLADDPHSHNLLVLVGPSGSGKSSLLGAGVVPTLRNAESRPWTVSQLVPGNDPTTALQIGLDELATAPRALLVVDQAEEVFSPEVSDEARQAFVRGLVEAARPAADHPLVVVIGLRADFYGQAASDPDLLDALRTSQILLGSMSLPELRRAVVRPAEAVGVSVDPELVDLLVRDLTPRGPTQSGYDAGALPLVSHALLATWQRHTGDRLTVGDYVAVGGIGGAVQQTAERVVNDLDDAGRAAAQWLFTQLVTVDDDGVMTRRRVSPDDLHHPDPATDLALDAVIEVFIAGRLLTAGDTTLEISHEALLTAWPRLRDWVLTDLDAARLQRRIADAADVWRERDHDPAALLRGGPLADAVALASRPPTSPRLLSSGDQQFVAASAEQAQQEVDAERHRTNRLRTLVAVMTGLAVLAGVLTWTAFQARDQAQQQEQAAAQARDEALSRQLAITADGLGEKDPALAAQLALAAYQTAPTLQARSSLLSTTGFPTPTRIVGPKGEMSAVSRADGSLLAVSTIDGVTRLFAPSDTDGTTTYEPVGELSPTGQAGATYASAFTPDGSRLALGLADGRVVLWDLSDLTSPRLVGELTEPGASVQAIAFNRDGTQLAAGTSEPSVLRWSVPADGSEPTPLPTISDEFAGMVKSVAYSPTEDTLATGTADATIRLWSAEPTGRSELLGSASVGESTDFIDAVSFSPDGTRLASAEKGRVVRIWDVTDPTDPTQKGEPMAGFDSWANSVHWSPDGTRVAAASSDGTVRVFAADSGQQVAVLPNPSAATQSQFVGPNGDLLLTAGIDGVARLWPMPGPMVSFTDSIFTIQVTEDGSALLVGPGAVQNALHLIDTSSGAPGAEQKLIPPASAGAADGAADMSADGQWIAGGTGTGNLAVWERVSPDAAPQLRGVVSAADQLIEGVAIGKQGEDHVVTAIADDGSVGVWRLVSGQAPELAYELSVGGLPLNAAFSPDGTLLAVAVTDHTVHLWRVTGEEAKEFEPLGGFENYANSVAFDSTGRYLASGSSDKTVRIWDISKPEAPVAVGTALSGPRDTVFAVDWSPDGKFLVGSSKDGSLWVWDTSDVQAPELMAILAGDGGAQYSVVTAPNSTDVLGGGADDTVRTWSTDVDAVAATMCARTGTPMTQAEWEQLAPGAAFSPPCPTTQD